MMLHHIYKGTNRTSASDPQQISHNASVSPRSTSGKDTNCNSTTNACYTVLSLHVYHCSVNYNYVYVNSIV